MKLKSKAPCVASKPSKGELEDRTAPILKRLIQSRALAEIAVDELMILAAFCAVQIVRTPTFRDRIKNVSDGIADALRKRGIDPEKIPNFKIPSKAEVKDLSLRMLAEAPTKYAPDFLDKHWYLIDGRTDDPFHLGDHPVVLDNDFIREAPGGLGLADRLEFAFICRSVRRFASAWWIQQRLQHCSKPSASSIAAMTNSKRRD